MATTKKTTTRSTRSTRAPARSTTRRRAEPTAVEATTETIKRNPYASAAVATGVVGAIAAAAAGFLAFKKSGKTFSEFSGDIATSVKDKAAETSERVKDGLADARTMAKDQVSKLRDGIDSNGKTQSEIAEEALTLKQTGSTTDPLIEQQSKVGSVSY
ncbi:MAG: hypothetical protein ABIU10_07485 [Sphingomicrobium sp.]